MIKGNKIIEAESKTVTFVVTTDANTDEERTIAVGPFLSKEAYDLLLDGDDKLARRELEQFANKVEKSLSIADKISAKIERRYGFDVEAAYTLNVEVVKRRRGSRARFNNGRIGLNVDGLVSVYLYKRGHGGLDQVQFVLAKGSVPIFRRLSDGKTKTLEDFIRLRLDGMGPGLVKDLLVVVPNYHDAVVGPFLFKGWEFVGFEQT